ncbi:MAG: glycosyltransferase [Candidatus Omnitrophota bacterium]
MKELVSVIIPAYNCARYISEALDSVFYQTYRDFEVIVIDDGSTDGTIDILKKYAAEHPGKMSCIYQKNSGPGKARNRGIKEARGEYVAFLDSDDIWLPEKLKAQLDFFKKEPSLALVHSDFMYFNNSGITKKSEFSSTAKRNFSGSAFYPLVKENFIRTSTVVVKKIVLEVLGAFDEDFFMSEDYDLWLRIAKVHDIGYVNDRIVNVRQHADHISRRDIRETYLWIDRVMEKLVKTNPEIGKEIKRYLSYRFAKNHYTIGYDLFCKGRLKEAREEFVRSLGCRFQKDVFIYYLATFLRFSFISFVKRFKQRSENGKTELVCKACGR